MNEIIENAEEFLASGEDNMKKERWNAAVTDFFKAIAAWCDYLIYREIKTLPKNHTERFALLRTHFSQLYEKITVLFRTYRESYTLRLKKEDALVLKDYAHTIRNFVRK